MTASWNNNAVFLDRAFTTRTAEDDVRRCIGTSSDAIQWKQVWLWFPSQSGTAENMHKEWAIAMS